MIYKWYAEVRQHKRVMLSDVFVCKSVTCNDIIHALMGLEVYEWERYMSHIFSEAILKAFKYQENMADITRMFSCNLVAIDDCGEHTKQQKDVCEILLNKLFKTVSETDEELIVSLKSEVIKHSSSTIL